MIDKELETIIKGQDIILDMAEKAGKVSMPERKSIIEKIFALQQMQDVYMSSKLQLSAKQREIDMLNFRLKQERKLVVSLLDRLKHYASEEEDTFIEKVEKYIK